MQSRASRAGISFALIALNKHRQENHHSPYSNSMYQYDSCFTANSRFFGASDFINSDILETSYRPPISNFESSSHLIHILLHKLRMPRRIRHSRIPAHTRNHRITHSTWPQIRRRMSSSFDRTRFICIIQPTSPFLFLLFVYPAPPFSLLLYNLLTPTPPKHALNIRKRHIPETNLRFVIRAPHTLPSRYIVLGFVAWCIA